MPNKILVIGSNSFSGSHFVNYLLTKGYKVLGSSRSNQPKKVFLPYLNNKNKKNFKFIRCNLNLNQKPLVDLIKKEKPKYIVNFSAQGMVAQSWEAPLDWFTTNVISQVKFHDEIRKFEFIEKYVHFTTPEVYGNTNTWIKENNIFSPNSPYATSRAACDLNLLSFYKNYGFPVVFTRAANVFGPFQQLYRIIPRTIMSCLLDFELDLHGGGISERSFIDIRDTVDATYKVMMSGEKGETYHISTKRKISIRNIVLKVFTIMGKDFDKLVRISDERLGKDQAYLLNSNKIRNDLKWKEQYKLEATIEDTIEWATENLNILKTLPLNYKHKK